MPGSIGLLHGRGVRPLGKWRDVADQFPGLLVHAPDVATRATVIVSARAIAQGRQKPDQITVARWTLRDGRHGKALEPPPQPAKDPALILRADTTAPVVNDEEKRARATTQVHKVAREGYRLDVSGSAFWAGCYRATTLVARARHVGTALLAARNVPLTHIRFAPSCGPSGPVATPKSWEGIPLVYLGDLSLTIGSGTARPSRPTCCRQNARRTVTRSMTSTLATLKWGYCPADCADSRMQGSEVSVKRHKSGGVLLFP